MSLVFCGLKNFKIFLTVLFDFNLEFIVVLYKQKCPKLFLMFFLFRCFTLGKKAKQHMVVPSQNGYVSIFSKENCI